MKNIDKFHPS